MDRLIRRFQFLALETLLPALLHKRNLAHEWHGNSLFDFLSRAYPGIKEEPAYQDDKRKGKADEYTQEQSLALTRGNMAVLRLG